MESSDFGDAADDMTAATILLLVGGQLVLLTPRKVCSPSNTPANSHTCFIQNSARDVKYDLRILADRIEFCWIHLRGVGALENSLWGYDGDALRIWLDALTINSHRELSPHVSSVVENVRLPLEFYPLCRFSQTTLVLCSRTFSRSYGQGYNNWRGSRGTHPALTAICSISPQYKCESYTYPAGVAVTNFLKSHLFIHHILRYHLQKNQVKEAIQFALPYQNLVFFSHSLEVLLHTVLESEDEAAEDESVLPAVIEFLDHFDASLEVVVGCARKTEMMRWKRLFDAVGSPRALFEVCTNLLICKPPNYW